MLPLVGTKRTSPSDILPLITSFLSTPSPSASISLDQKVLNRPTSSTELNILLRRNPALPHPLSLSLFVFFLV
ncbi:hypothetical protein PGT21_005450 [Puccinia graminis f. sp. tritici]|uniref:Uncharacterized protein n=1 Tax=Puccinia graminis f. sp. tritici TaxID=56615 RepID=A0A5B0NMS6_PUCGR|nr:hypothetical protein PGTUg99_030610 [Puccinia graminis f. sp. tritici]KAA1090567.1 hypothetical protein PGT21_005450 [Puccinia graminis f. sp. tritici]